MVSSICLSWACNFILWHHLNEWGGWIFVMQCCFFIVRHTVQHGSSKILVVSVSDCAILRHVRWMHGESQRYDVNRNIYIWGLRSSLENAAEQLTRFGHSINTSMQPNFLFVSHLLFWFWVRVFPLNFIQKLHLQNVAPAKVFWSAKLQINCWWTRFMSTIFD